MSAVRRRSLASTSSAGDPLSAEGPSSEVDYSTFWKSTDLSFNDVNDSTDNLVRNPLPSGESSGPSLDSSPASVSSILQSSRPSVTSDARVRFQAPTALERIDTNVALECSQEPVNPVALPESSAAAEAVSAGAMSVPHMILNRRLHQHASNTDLARSSQRRNMAESNMSEFQSCGCAPEMVEKETCSSPTTLHRTALPSLPSYLGPDSPLDDISGKKHLRKCLTCGSMPDLHDHPVIAPHRQISINGSLLHMPRRISMFGGRRRETSNLPPLSNNTSTFSMPAHPNTFGRDIERSISMRAEEVMSLHEQIYSDYEPISFGIGGSGGSPLKRPWKSTVTMFAGVSASQRVMTRDFLMGLARAFAQYGAPSHRIEYQLELVALALEQPASFVVIPGVIWISFGDEDHSSSTHLIKVGQSWNMYKLSRVNHLCRSVINGDTDVCTAIDNLTEISVIDDYPAWWDYITYPIVSFTICAIGFGGRWVDSGVSAFLGLCVCGMSSIASKRFREFSHLVPFLCALFCSFFSRVLLVALRSAYPNFCYNHVSIVLSGIVMLLPGLSITISMIEIATRNIVSGTVRVFFAMFHAMLLGFGISTGRALVTWGPSPEELDANSPSCPGALSPLWNFAFFPPLCVAFILNFQAKRPQFLHVSIISTLGWVIYLLLSIPPAFQTATGQIVPNIVAAFGIGVSANIYARITKDVAVPGIIIGIVMMVPGSMGVRATLGFFGSNATNAVQVVFQMLMIGMSIGIGLFMASLAVFPVKGPRYKYMTI